MLSNYIKKALGVALIGMCVCTQASNRAGRKTLAKPKEWLSLAKYPLLKPKTDKKLNKAFRNKQQYRPTSYQKMHCSLFEQWQPCSSQWKKKQEEHKYQKEYSSEEDSQERGIRSLGKYGLFCLAAGGVDTKKKKPELPVKKPQEPDEGVGVSLKVVFNALISRYGAEGALAGECVVYAKSDNLKKFKLIVDKYPEVMKFHLPKSDQSHVPGYMKKRRGVNSVFNAAVMYKANKIVKYCLEHEKVGGYSLLQERGRFNATPLMYAGHSNMVWVAELILERHPEELYVRTVHGNTAAHIAAAHEGASDILTLLHKYDPKCLHMRNNEGYTPLAVAVERGNVDNAATIVILDPTTCFYQLKNGQGLLSHWEKRGANIHGKEKFDRAVTAALERPEYKKKG